MMKVTAFRMVVWTRLSALGSYWIVALAVPGHILLEVMTWFAAAIAGAVVVVYGRIGFDALRASRPDHVQHLALGILLSWAASFGLWAWSGAWRYLDRPEWMEESHVEGFLLWAMAIAGVLHILAPGQLDRDRPLRMWGLLLTAFCAGASVSAAALLLSFRR